MILLTQTVSLLRKPVSAPLPYLMEKLVPFFVYVDDLELSYLSCVPVKNKIHSINCNQYSHSLSNVKTHGREAQVQACTHTCRPTQSLQLVIMVYLRTEHKITAGQRTFSEKSTACQSIFKFVLKKCPGEGLVN